MFMYTCKSMSCIYSISCIYSYMCISSQSRSEHHLVRCQRQWWQCQRMKIFVWECWGIWGVWTSWFFVHSEHETDEVKTKGSLGEFFFGGIQILTSNRRKLTLTPTGGSLWEGEGNGNHQNATVPVSIPGSIHGNNGKSRPCAFFLFLRKVYFVKPFNGNFCEQGRARFGNMEFSGCQQNVQFYFQPNSDRFRTRSGAVHDEGSEWTCSCHGLCGKMSW